MTTPFDQWWAFYPNKVSKKPARVAYAKAAKSVGDKVLLDAVKEYRQAVDGWNPDNERYIPYPASWLNAERWEDDRSKWVDQQQRAVQAKLTAEKRRFQRVQEDNRKRTMESDALEAEMQTPEYQAAKRASFAQYRARRAEKQQRDKPLPIGDLDE